MKNIYLLMAPSGAGKTVIQELLCNTYKLTPVVSYTTRTRRFGENDNHIFVTQEVFNALENKVAYVHYNGNDYCATLEQIENSDVYVIDPKGIEYFRKYYRGSKKIKIIYIQSPVHTRMNRMEERGDPFDMALERIVNDILSFYKAEDIADMIVNNNDTTRLSDIVKQIWDYIEKCEEN